MTISIREPGQCFLDMAMTMIAGICTLDDDSAERAEALRESNHVVFNHGNLLASGELEGAFIHADVNGVYCHFANKCTDISDRVFFLYMGQEDLARAIREAAFGLMDNPYFR